MYGNITLDGQPRKAWASRLVAYVPQFDFLLPTLTVAETLRYSALLRLPKDTQGAEVQVRSACFAMHSLVHISQACEQMRLPCRVLHWLQSVAAGTCIIQRAPS